MDINIVVDRFIQVTALKEKVESEYNDLSEKASMDHNPSEALVNYLLEVRKRLDDVNLVYDSLRDLYIKTLHSSTEIEIELSMESIDYMIKANEEQIKLYKNKRDSAALKLFGDLSKEEMKNNNDIINFANEKLSRLMKTTMIYENFYDHLGSELKKRNKKNK